MFYLTEGVNTVTAFGHLRTNLLCVYCGYCVNKIVFLEESIREKDLFSSAFAAYSLKLLLWTQIARIWIFLS